MICLGLQTSGEYDEQLRLNNFCQIRGRVANREEAAVPKRKESAWTKKGEYCFSGCSSVLCRRWSSFTFDDVYPPLVLGDTDTTLPHHSDEE